MKVMWEIKKIENGYTVWKSGGEERFEKTPNKAKEVAKKWIDEAEIG